MKQLIKTLQQDENSNKFYYDKMLKDFELESRYNAMVRSVRNKWHNESLKYIHRVHDMKEKKEENYITPNLHHSHYNPSAAWRNGLQRSGRHRN